ncbi:hypothetical protein ACOSQ3_020610 [Xanthoceras sorbifolium]
MFGTENVHFKISKTQHIQGMRNDTSNKKGNKILKASLPFSFEISTNQHLGVAHYLNILLIHGTDAIRKTLLPCSFSYYASVFENDVIQEFIEFKPSRSTIE